MHVNSFKRKQSNSLNSFSIAYASLFGLFGLRGLFGDMAATHADIAIGQVDTFSVSGDAGWIEGFQSPNPPTQVSDPGSDGVSGHLQNVSDGVGPGGRMQMRNNDLRWQGDYVSAGVTGISFFADNRSGNGTNLQMRIGLRGAGGVFVSDAVQLPDGSGWTPIQFQLSNLTYVSSSGGTLSLNDTLTSVNQFEILSSLTTPVYRGDTALGGDIIVGDLRVDNIAAVPEPAAGLLCALFGIGNALRRRRQA